MSQTVYKINPLYKYTKVEAKKVKELCLFYGVDPIELATWPDYKREEWLMDNIAKYKDGVIV